MKPFQFTKAHSLKDAISKKNSSTTFLAGGTNLFELMHKNIVQVEHIVDLNSSLSDKIEVTSDGVLIGALVRNSTLAYDPLIREKYPLISTSILSGASEQVRDMATVGGNVLQRTRCPYFYDTKASCNKRKPGTGCGAYGGENRLNAVIGHSESCVAVHPSDLCIALIALDAKVHIMTKSLEQKDIAFERFHRLPKDNPEIDTNLPENAVIESISVPKNPFNQNFSYIKLRDRDSFAFALVSVAAALQLDGDTIRKARLASGGVAHKPWRWYAAEHFLEGKKAEASIFNQVASMINKELEPLSNNRFKRDLLNGALMTALLNCRSASN